MSSQIEARGREKDLVSRGVSKAGARRKKGERRSPSPPSPRSTEVQLVAELDARKRALREYREVIVRLRRENAELYEELSRREGADHVDVERKRRELDGRDDQIQLLKERAVADVLARAKDAEIAELMWKEQLEDLEAEVADKEAIIAEFEAEEVVMRRYRDEEVGLVTEVERLRDELNALEARQEEELDRNRSKFEVEDEALRERQAAAERDLAASMEQSTLSALDAGTRQVLEDNERLREELQFQKDAERTMQERTAAAETETGELREALKALKARDRERTVAGSLASKEIRELRASLKNLQAAYARVEREFDAERTLVSDDVERAGLEGRMEADGLRRLAVSKAKELAKIKQLGRAVVERRSDVEVFLAAAIERVHEDHCAKAAEREADQVYEQERALQLAIHGRTELTASSVAGALNRTAADSHMPPLPGARPSPTPAAATSTTASGRSTSASMHSPTPGGRSGASSAMSHHSAAGSESSLFASTLGAPGAGAGLDFDEWTEADLERVLRIVFAKMNKQETRQTPRFAKTSTTTLR